MRKVLATSVLLGWAFTAQADIFAYLGGAVVRISTTPQVSVPNVTADNLTEADMALEAVGLDTGVTIARCSAEAANEVISQIPSAGVLVDEGTLVDLEYSSGTPCAPPKMLPKVRMGRGL
jgi:beta-lactam-binding protein with PASTA domain